MGAEEEGDAEENVDVVGIEICGAAADARFFFGAEELAAAAAAAVFGLTDDALVVNIADLMLVTSRLKSKETTVSDKRGELGKKEEVDFAKKVCKSFF